MVDFSEEEENRKHDVDDRQPQVVFKTREEEEYNHAQMIFSNAEAVLKRYNEDFRKVEIDFKQNTKRADSSVYNEAFKNWERADINHNDATVNLLKKDIALNQARKVDTEDESQKKDFQKKIDSLGIDLEIVNYNTFSKRKEKEVIQCKNNLDKMPADPHLKRELEAAKFEYEQALRETEVIKLKKAGFVLLSDPENQSLKSAVELQKAMLKEANARVNLADLNLELSERQLKSEDNEKFRHTEEAIEHLQVKASIAHNEAEIIEQSQELRLINQTVQNLNAEADKPESENTKNEMADQINYHEARVKVHSTALDAAKAKLAENNCELNVLNAKKSLEKNSDDNAKKIKLEAEEARLKVAKLETQAAIDSNDLAKKYLEIANEQLEAKKVNRKPRLEVTEAMEKAAKAAAASKDNAEREAKILETHPAIREDRRNEAISAALKGAKESKEQVELLKKEVSDKAALVAAAKAKVDAEPSNIQLAVAHTQSEEAHKRAQAKLSEAQGKAKARDENTKSILRLAGNIETAKKAVDEAQEKLKEKGDELRDVAAEAGDHSNEENLKRITEAEQAFYKAEAELEQATVAQAQAEDEADNVLSPAQKKQEEQKKEAEQSKTIHDFMSEQARDDSLLSRVRALFKNVADSDFGKYASKAGERIGKQAKSAHTLKEEDLLEAAIFNMLLLLLEMLFGMKKGTVAIWRELARDHLNSKEYRALAKEDHANALKEANKYKEDGEEPDPAKYQDALLKMAQAEKTYEKYGREEDNDKFDALKKEYDEVGNEFTKKSKELKEAKEAYDKAPFFHRKKESDKYEALKEEVKKIEVKQISIYSKIKDLSKFEGKHSADLEKMKADRNSNGHTDENMKKSFDDYAQVQKHSELQSEINAANVDIKRDKDELDDLNKNLEKFNKESEQELAAPNVSELHRKEIADKKRDLERQIKEKQEAITSSEELISEKQKQQEDLNLNPSQQEMAENEQERGKKATVKRLVKGGKGMFDQLKDWISNSEKATQAAISVAAGEVLASQAASSVVATVSVRPDPQPAPAAEGVPAAQPNPSPATPSVSQARRKPPLPKEPAPKFSPDAAARHLLKPEENVSKKDLLERYSELMIAGSKPNAIERSQSTIDLARPIGASETKKVKSLVLHAYLKSKNLQASPIARLSKDEIELVNSVAKNVMNIDSAKERFVKAFDENTEKGSKRKIGN